MTTLASGPKGGKCSFDCPFSRTSSTRGARHTFDALYTSWFSGITLAFHEMGHIVFSPFGRTLMLLGGSIFQLLIPLSAGLYLVLRQRDYFGGAVGGAWLSYATWEMGTYMDDANKERLGLVGFSDNPEHDWSALFTGWHVLNHSHMIATVVRVGCIRDLGGVDGAGGLALLGDVQDT